MVEAYNDNLSRVDLMTPEAARNRLHSLGYTNFCQVPIQHSDFLMALFFIATSNQPLNLADVRDQSRGSMRGRGGKSW